MDGLELVARLRQQVSQDRLAIIGISAEGSASLPACFLKIGAGDVLPNPFQNKEFLSRVDCQMELLELIQHIDESSRCDYLTGLYSRRWLFEAAPEFMARAQEQG